MLRWNRTKPIELKEHDLSKGKLEGKHEKHQNWIQGANATYLTTIRSFHFCEFTVPGKVVQFIRRTWVSSLILPFWDTMFIHSCICCPSDFSCNDSFVCQHGDSSSQNSVDTDDLRKCLRYDEVRRSPKSNILWELAVLRGNFIPSTTFLVKGMQLQVLSEASRE
jgi:hypothetical protein